MRKSVSLLAALCMCLAASLASTAAPAVAAPVNLPAVTSPAFASPPPSAAVIAARMAKVRADCPLYQFCWWQHDNFDGAWGHRSINEIRTLPGRCWSMGSWGNQASSFYNHSAATVTLWDAGNCTGTVVGPLQLNAEAWGSFTNSSFNDWLGGVYA